MTEEQATNPDATLPSGGNTLLEAPETPVSEAGRALRVLFKEKTPRVDQSKKFRKMFTKGNTAQVERFDEMFATPTKPDDKASSAPQNNVESTV